VDESSYLDLRHPEDGGERTAYFVLDSLLKSRIECGFESNSLRYDEDVNVYLVHLLTSLVRSPWLMIGTRRDEIADRDVDVFEKVRDSSDPRLKSRVYRMNADRLLVATGIFTQSPYIEMEGRRIFEDVTRDRIGRGKAYYQFAALFYERLKSISPALTRVLGTLSEDFERYVDVLIHMRGEYFNLFERLREDQLMALRSEAFQDPPSGGESGDISVLRDEFLDAYWVWHQCQDPSSRNALIETVKRLKAADPSFEFKLPES
jgi:hypothetical protein